MKRAAQSIEWTCDDSIYPRAVNRLQIIKHDFGLKIDIEELINTIDLDGSGEIEFEEFKRLLS